MTALVVLFVVVLLPMGFAAGVVVGMLLLALLQRLRRR